MSPSVPPRILGWLLNCENLCSPALDTLSYCYELSPNVSNKLRRLSGYPCVRQVTLLTQEGADTDAHTSYSNSGTHNCTSLDLLYGHCPLSSEGSLDKQVPATVITLYSGLHNLQSVLRQVRSLFQSEFSTECDLVLPLSISSIFSFP
jgi:hypothetical protein